jgi:hypothetical protein
MDLTIFSRNENGACSWDSHVSLAGSSDEVARAFIGGVRGFESVYREPSSFLPIRLSRTVSPVTPRVAMAAAEDDQREVGRRQTEAPSQPPTQHPRSVGQWWLKMAARPWILYSLATATALIVPSGAIAHCDDPD